MRVHTTLTTSLWPFAACRVSTGITALQLALPWLYKEYRDLEQYDQQVALIHVRERLQSIVAGQEAPEKCPNTQVRRNQRLCMSGGF